jgi:hypothetical protein
MPRPRLPSSCVYNLVDSCDGIIDLRYATAASDGLEGCAPGVDARGVFLQPLYYCSGCCASCGFRHEAMVHLVVSVDRKSHIFLRKGMKRKRQAG